MMNTAGIDVGAGELSVVIRKNGKAGKVKVYENDAKGHRQIINSLKKAKVERICLEATGVYHLDLAVALNAVEFFDLMVLNPRAAKNYASAIMNRTKTDAVDAAILAEYAERMEFIPWKCPNTSFLEIRACARRLAALTKQRTQSKNQLHALQSVESTPSFILEDVELTIQQLNAQIEQMRASTLTLVANDQELSETLELLQSVTGIGDVSAIQIMGEILVLPEEMQAKQWVAMAGLDPKQHQSGSSVNKKARISKVGNRYLRMALYMPALTASTHDRHVRGYYLHLIEDRGLKKLQALCAVMRKLLHAIHGMLKSRTQFDNTRFYAMENTSS
jgi:transposase